MQTGSLSKAQFIARADAICAAARNQFTREYTAFFKSNRQPKESQAEQEAWVGELVDDIVLPNYEKRIDEISALGAPSAFTEEAAAFLNALQRRLREIEEEPTEVAKTAFPFEKAAKVAQQAGLTGCASSFG